MITSSQMTERSKIVLKEINSLAAIFQQNAAATEEVAASTQEMNAATEEVLASTDAMAGMAEELKSLVNQFRL